MKRFQLEHIIRAGGSIADDEEIIVLGSSSILAQFPNISEEVLKFLCLSRQTYFPKTNLIWPILSMDVLENFHLFTRLSDITRMVLARRLPGISRGVGTAGFCLSEMKILEVLLAGAWKSTTWPLENTMQGEKKTISLFLRLLPMEWSIRL